MDNDRPSLELKFFDHIFPDKNGMSKRDFTHWESGTDISDMWDFSSPYDSGIHKV